MAEWREKLKLQHPLPVQVFKNYLPVWLHQSRNFPVPAVHMDFILHCGVQEAEEGSVVPAVENLLRVLLPFRYHNFCQKSDFCHLKEP